ncbi:hypothetical protein VTN00DRAFT_7161 [Thermoascus crustaceus]|uniref:uncharacterized protein n=1 Tax=Thermoascus crustaceus TaxID=5088 RepID=UPI0037443EC6
MLVGANQDLLVKSTLGSELSFASREETMHSFKPFTHMKRFVALIIKKLRGRSSKKAQDEAGDKDNHAVTPPSYASPR